LVFGYLSRSSFSSNAASSALDDETDGVLAVAVVDCRSIPLTFRESSGRLVERRLEESLSFAPRREGRVEKEEGLSFPSFSGGADCGKMKRGAEGGKEREE
jgi:hypothetical protein